jgi:hypothetical protein
MIDVRLESITRANGRPHWFDGRVVQLDHSVALAANQMMVPLALQQLENAHTSAQVGFRNDSGIPESLECAVNRRTVQG